MKISRIYHASYGHGLVHTLRLWLNLPFSLHDEGLHTDPNTFASITTLHNREHIGQNVLLNCVMSKTHISLHLPQVHRL